MSDRGMKKWAPYRSLPEKDIVDLKMKKNKNKISKPLISNEEAEEINQLLSNHEDVLVFTIYKNGTLVDIVGQIKNIDEVNRQIILKNRDKIYLRDIVRAKKYI